MLWIQECANEGGITITQLLEVTNLSVSYHTYAGEVQSVRGISFDVKEGETLAIVGESGCGKSVTARSIMGLIKPPIGEIKLSSEIRYRGKNILTFTSKEWAYYRGGESSIIFQDALTALNPTMTIGDQITENIFAHEKISKKAAVERATGLLEQVGIPDASKKLKSYPHQLSGGMRQRVMIAIAFACNPKLLIADEPTTALDVTIQAQILDMIRSLQVKKNTSVMLITHDLGIVANIASRVIIMYSGRIVERGSSDDIFYHPKHPYTIALLRAIPKLTDKSKEKLYSIEGRPPDLLDPPKGCPFAARCPYCMNVCVEANPESFDFGLGHTASCWLHHSQAPKVEWSI
ncbi:ABC transporter ATP-binding protein [Sporolactobacillus shoreicorticis]|uniref:ABC transporter ATP-binding protein n=1 Tax=Sporolactobacillus shoreicorticis TaxID=1923877 RepID=A0ABW5S362_9BACL|nr:ABC transporter ATP-binding protein [Sporolactobacillus shoreicorticis]MCO7127076.1 ABC transporter ATP-binding protein [Sporolactobacillus shoreicorticis]